MLPDTAKSKTKSLVWTSTTQTAFEKIKNLVNQYQKLYFIDYCQTRDFGLKYIIVIVDCFTRYVELLPKQEFSAMAAFTAPLEIVTDYGPQFVNQMLTNFDKLTRVRHHMTYSKIMLIR